MKNILIKSKKRLNFMLLIFFVFVLLSCLTNVSVQSSNIPDERHIWSSGNVDKNIEGTFTVLSWEPKNKAEPYMNAVTNFLDTYYPNIELQFNYGVDWGEYWTKLPTMISSGNPPDLVMMHDSQVKSYASAGMLENIDKFVEELPPLGWPFDFYSGQPQAYTYENKLYAIPADFVTGGVYFNKDIFDKAGVNYPPEWSKDWNVNDLLEKAKKLTKDLDGDGKMDQWGVMIGTRLSQSPHWFFHLFNGGYFDVENKKALFTQPGTIEAVQMLADMRHKWKVTPIVNEEYEMGRLFTQGKLAMYFKHSGRAQIFDEKIGDEFDWGVAPPPSGPNGQRAQFAGSSSYAIPKGASHPQLAYEVMRYVLTNPEKLPDFARARSQFPSRQSFYPFALTKNLYNKLPNYNYVFSISPREDGIVPPFFENYGKFTSLWNEYLDPVFLTGEQTAEEALQQLQKEAQKLLED